MHDDDEDDDDDGRETGRSAPAPLRGGKFRDVDLDQDWDSDDPDDEYVEEDEEDEEEDDDDDVLRDLDLRAVFMERLAAAGNGQVVARLSDADRRDVQLYLDAASKQQQQQAAAAAH
ncbi:hypothetical protein PBRA_008593 [Plasmodiophora brassicae]|uniref:Uncharacterized protein n=1 Tax=Plasmodiophora brassicae TaxID=37360 RepID=A0A0G4J344_PLABS|nr:hypothetical protein PBRA_008593 [Plasmodiophora brassicae]